MPKRKKTLPDRQFEQYHISASVCGSSFLHSGIGSAEGGEASFVVVSIVSSPSTFHLEQFHLHRPSIESSFMSIVFSLKIVSSPSPFHCKWFLSPSPFHYMQFHHLRFFNESSFITIISPCYELMPYSSYSWCSEYNSASQTSWLTRHKEWHIK